MDTSVTPPIVACTARAMTLAQNHSEEVGMVNLLCRLSPLAELQAMVALWIQGKSAEVQGR